MVDESSGKKAEIAEKWPLSNYPILLALILLVATAISLGVGESEAYANQLAIYAYFLLVIGVAVRFFELVLPERVVQRLKINSSKIKSGRDVSKSEDKLDFFADVTRNVLFSMLLFFIIAISYGVLVDWFFVRGFVKELGYVIVVFLVLHLLLKYGVKM